MPTVSSKFYQQLLPTPFLSILSPLQVTLSQLQHYSPSPYLPLPGHSAYRSYSSNSLLQFDPLPPMSASKSTSTPSAWTQHRYCHSPYCYAYPPISSFESVSIKLSHLAFDPPNLPLPLRVGSHPDFSGRDYSSSAQRHPRWRSRSSDWARSAWIWSAAHRLASEKLPVSSTIAAADMGNGFGLVFSLSYCGFEETPSWSGLSHGKHR